jgi:CBS domain-containing protein
VVDDLAEGLMPEVKVREIMRHPVYVISEDKTIDEAAKMMAQHEVGSLVVVNRENKPVGIITERDLVRRVMIKNLLPSQVKIKQVMSKPLITIPPDITVNEAARQMGRASVKKLVVVDRGKLIGIISSREVIYATPPLIDVIYEKLKTNVILTRRRGGTMPGYCEACGQWSDALTEVGGSWLCEECAAEAESGTGSEM